MSGDDQNVAIFVDEEEFQEIEDQEVQVVYKDREPYSEDGTKARELSPFIETDTDAEGREITRLTRPPKLKGRATAAFHDAFELIGGVSRLATWADTHPTDFFKLYARNIPVEGSHQEQTDAPRKVIHSVPRCPLDE